MHVKNIQFNLFYQLREESPKWNSLNTEASQVNSSKHRGRSSSSRAYLGITKRRFTATHVSYLKCIHRKRISNYIWLKPSRDKLHEDRSLQDTNRQHVRYIAACYVFIYICSHVQDSSNYIYYILTINWLHGNTKRASCKCYRQHSCTTCLMSAEQ